MSAPIFECPALSITFANDKHEEVSFDFLSSVCYTLIRKREEINLTNERRKEMKIPKMLDDYLLETEQEAEAMRYSELFEEARWILSEYKCGDYYTGLYSKKDVAQLKAFITRISAKM